jgi:hypothetical protein
MSFRVLRSSCQPDNRKRPRSGSRGAVRRCGPSEHNSGIREGCTARCRNRRVGGCDSPSVARYVTRIRPSAPGKNRNFEIPRHGSEQAALGGDSRAVRQPPGCVGGDGRALSAVAVPHLADVARATRASRPPVRVRALALRRRAEFEHVIAENSTRLINCQPAETAVRPKQVLADLARAIAVERAYVVLREPRPRTCPVRGWNWLAGTGAGAVHTVRRHRARRPPVPGQTSPLCRPVTQRRPSKPPASAVGPACR